MSALSDEDVIGRIEALANVAIAEVAAPPIEFGEISEVHVAPAPSTTGRPQRRLLVAASVTALALGAGAVWSMRPDDGVRAIDVDPAGLSAEIDAVLPTEWPSVLDGPVVAHVDDVASGAVLDPTTVAIESVLTVDGRAAVVVQAVDAPILELTATFPEQVVDDVGTDAEGRTTHWRERSDGGVLGFVALAPGRSLVIAARWVDRSVIAQVAVSVASADGDPANATLPTGWATTGFTDLANLILEGGTGRGWSTVSRRSSDNERHLGISTRPSDDPETELRQLAELAGTTGQRVDIAGSHGLLLTTTDPSGRIAGHSMVWSPGPGLVSRAWGDSVDPEQILTAARSARRATQSEWDELLPDFEFPARVEHDGFSLPDTASVLSSGETSGLRWALVFDDTVTTPEGQEDEVYPVDHWLELRDQHGRQISIPEDDPNNDPNTSIVGKQRFGAHFVVTTHLPKGSTDVVVQRGTEVLTTDRVVLPTGGQDLYFTVVPGRDIDHNHFAVLRATLPDGRQLVRLV